MYNYLIIAFIIFSIVMQLNTLKDKKNTAKVFVGITIYSCILILCVYSLISGRNINEIITNILNKITSFIK